MLVERLATRFTVREHTIVGNLFIPRSARRPAPGVILCHGRCGNQYHLIPRAEFISKQGIICLSFDNRGRGESEGDFQSLTLADGLWDALAAYDFLASRDEIDIRRLGILGESYGGYLATIVSLQRCVKSMVLALPAIYRDEWLEESHARFESHRTEVTKFRESSQIPETQSLNAISKFRGSLLIISGGNDKVVPKTITEAYYNHAWQAKEKNVVTIKDANHTLDKAEWQAEINRLAAKWFARTL